jgi:gamma-glutamyltranspeptidase/glutathione hydrolase
MKRLHTGSWVALLTIVVVSPLLLAQTSLTRMCGEAGKTQGDSAPYCSAVRGDRSEGWLQQTRSEVMARNGVVSTVQPLAAQAGLRILQQGGNAIDAAVATAAMLNVVFPQNVGIGGDLFALIYVAKEKKVYQLNASGIAPAGLTLQRMQQLGYKANPANFGPGSGMPGGGILTVTVPGSLWGWQEVLTRFGTKSFKDVLQPAVDYAEQGFPVTEKIASLWKMKNALPLQACCTQVDPDSTKTFYVNGKPPVAGTIFRNPDLAKAFRLIQQQGRDAFYKGDIGRAVVAKSQALGGPMTLDDLANYKGEWVTPASTTYHGEFNVYTTRAPSQAWGIVEALNVLEACVPTWYPGQTLASLGPANPLYWHALVETKKAVYRDVYGHNADPNAVPVPLDMLTSKPHAASLCSKVNPQHAASTGPANSDGDGAGDTIYLATADRWGNMVSWINSNFSTWGSGITVPGYGFILHNRGGLFTLDAKSPNVIAGNKRPYNTLSAVLVMRNGRPLLVTGQHGGDQQGQGNMQVLVNVLDLGANMQAAGDIARFSHNQVRNELQMESQLYQLVGPRLKEMGHKVSSTDGGPVGGYEGIMFTPDANGGRGCAADDGKCTAPIGGVYRAGSNFREDGQSAGY